MNLKEIVNTSVVQEVSNNKCFVIYNEYERRYYRGFWVKTNIGGEITNSPEWVQDWEYDSESFVIQDELPMMGTSEYCEKELAKIKEFYIKFDGECEGIVIKKIKLISRKLFKVEILKE